MIWVEVWLVLVAILAALVAARQARIALGHLTTAKALCARSQELLDEAQRLHTHC